MDSDKQRKSPSIGGRPFSLGVHTYRDRALIPSGALSLVSNMRNTHPGIRKRRGMSRLQTVLGTVPGWSPPIITTLVRSQTYYADFGIAGEGATDGTWTAIRDSKTATRTRQLQGGCANSTPRVWCGAGLFRRDGTNLKYHIGRTHFCWDMQNYTAFYPFAATKFRVYFCGTAYETMGGSPTDYTSTFALTGVPTYNFAQWSVTTYGDSNAWNYYDDTVLSDVISSAGKDSSGTYMDFTLNAAGLSYLNNFFAGGHYTGYRFVLFLREYAHDIMNSAPTAEGQLYRWQPSVMNAIYPADTGEEPRLYGADQDCNRQWFMGYQYVAAREEHDLGGGLGVQYEKKTFGQTRTGSVLAGTNNPPTVTAGEWGAVVFPANYSVEPLPASFSILNDIMIFSDGISQHQLWAGPRGRISACYVNAGAVATNYGADIWENVVDSDGGYATIPTITYSTSEGIIVGTTLAANRMSIIFKTPATGNSRATTVDYLNSAGTWAAATGVTDGTVISLEGFRQNGTISWDYNASDIGYLHRGQFLHWYRFRPGVQNTWTGAEIDQIYHSFVGASNNYFQPLANMWDGIYIPAVEARVHRDGSLIELTYGGTSIDLSSEAETGKLFVGFLEEPLDVLIDVGETPNILASDTTALSCRYWNGSSWVSMSGVSDQSAGFIQSGRLSWTPLTRNADGTSLWKTCSYGTFNSKPIQENLQLYWMEISWAITTATALGDITNISISSQPRKSITPFGSIGLCSTVWKERACYVFNRYPSYFYVTANGSVNILNGEDYAVLQAGDGRKNKIVSMRKFHNELIVWQEEHGDEGGCTTLFEGYSPATFGKLLLSSKVGALNSKATVVVDGGAATTKSTENFQTKAYWISRYGVFECDGRIVTRISDPIQNYFDPRFSECIRRGYENEHWIFFDSFNFVLRMGIVSGSSATRPNIFPVYDVLAKEWAFDTYASAAKGPVAMFECDTESGNFGALPVALPQGSCWVYLANQGLNDDGDAIDGAARPEVNAAGQLFNVVETYVRIKAQPAGDVIMNLYGNGKLLTDEARTLPMQVEYTNEEFIRHRLIDAANQVSNASIELRNNVVDQDLYLYDYIANTSIHEKK